MSGTSREHQGDSDATIASLVSGIIDDLEQLMNQHLELAKAEIESEVTRRLTALMSFLAAIGMFFVGLIVLSLGFVNVLHTWSATSRQESELLPLWVCYFIVAGILVAIGAVILRFSRSKWW